LELTDTCAKSAGCHSFGASRASIGVVSAGRADIRRS